MPAHNFMLADLAGSLVATCLFPLFVLLPGYAIGWLADLFDFRRRSFAFQLTLSVPLAIAICPVVTYFSGRFGSMTAVWAFYGASWIYALAVAARRPISLAPYARIVVLLCGAWAAIAIFSLIDLQIGNRAWYPSAAFDYSVRTQFIHSIATTGIPPDNPFFLPGHPVPLRYHYFWLQLCALVDLAGGSLVTARHAWIAGAVWTGFGLMAIVALYFRLFSYRGPATFRRRALTGILLLGVTGLDILPTALLWALQAFGINGIRPSMEWWNEQVDGFVYTTLWESHYLSSLIACLMAFLILWAASSEVNARSRLKCALLAGLALASAAGASVYVAFVFGIFLLAWTAVALAKGWRRETAMLIAAGLIGLALSLPYALSLRGPAGSQAASAAPLQFWMRPFSPVDALFNGSTLAARSWLRPLANALALPLNYFLELGFFLAAALVWWKSHRAPEKTRAGTAVVLMIATSVMICTFLRSSVIANNDLGWRGFLVAQFGLLLLAVDVVSDWSTAISRRQRVFLTVLLALGAAGSTYEVAINRFYPLLVDSGIANKHAWLGPDRQAGERNYAHRQAGEWAAAATPGTAVVQFSPHVAVEDTSAMLYSDRRMLAATDDCFTIFGGDPALCPDLIARLSQVYPPAGQAAPATLDSVCASLPIDVIGARDTDPVWNDRSSWVWTQTPAFANRFVRLFRCENPPAVTLR
jgi:hypothetical protein